MGVRDFIELGNLYAKWDRVMIVIMKKHVIYALFWKTRVHRIATGETHSLREFVVNIYRSGH